jgi:hypothetical protein
MKRTLRLARLVSLLLILAPAIRGAVWTIGPNSYIAGVPTDQFRYSAARQRQENWCWAASVQMVLNFHGLCVTQEQVVQRIYGQQVNQPANNAQILTALSGWAPDACGRPSAITASPYAWDEAVVDDLAYDWPLIVGLENTDGSGHAYVLTAVQFHNETYIRGYTQRFWQGRWYSMPVYAQRPVFDYVYLRDPWPSNVSKQTMPYSDFKSKLMFCDRVRVIRL